MANILIVFPKIEEAIAIKNLLVKQGFQVVGVSNTAAQILNQMNGLSQGVVISGYKLTDMMYSQLKTYLPKGFEMLLVASKQAIQECYDKDIVTLSMPLRPQELVLTTRTMVDNIDYQNRRKKEGPVLRSVSEKERIQKAKLLIMAQKKWSEEEAYRYLQKTSMDSGNSMIEVAEMILTLHKK